MNHSSGRYRATLSPVDTAWFRMEHPTNLMMITGVFMFSHPLEMERLQEVISTRLLRFRRFRQKVVQSRFNWIPPYWEDDPHFDLSSHLHRIALPAPGNQVALQELVNDFMSTPLDFTKPLWQIHLVENYGSGCALLCRLHHCIADGIALMRVLLSLTDDDPMSPNTSPIIEEETPPKFKTFGSNFNPFSERVHGARKFSTRLIKQSQAAFSDPEQFFNSVRLGLGGSVAVARLLLLPPDPSTPLKGTLNVQKRCAWSQPIPLTDVKAIGKVTGGTVNDVMLTAVTGALGRYLRTQGEPIAGLDIRAVLPVNLRPPVEDLKLGNSFGLVFISLPLGIDDPLERLFELKRRMDKIKGSAEAIATFGILFGVGVTTNDVEELVVNIFEKKATTVITNVPGPQEVRYIAGQPIEDLMFWVPQSGRLGLGVSILSYTGKVLVGVACDAGLIPIPEVIIKELSVEFAELMDLVHYAREADLELAQQCAATTKKGDRCRNKAVEGSSFCHLHQG